jgi:cytoskeleton protein RodZ
MDVGAALREARERRGISLEALARTTKIGVATLRALERNQVDHLPGGIFLRGFLRAYARQVELDPEDTVRRYLAQFERPPAAAVATETAGTELESTPLVHHDTDIGESGRRPIPMRVLMVGLALALCAVTYIVTLRGSRTPAESSQDAVDQTEVATSGREADAALTSQSDTVIRLDIQTPGSCWIAATADGRSVAYRLMQPGERHVIEARDHIVLRVGDPASFTYRINDLPGRSLGRAGRAVTVRISSENYREFISP